MSRTLSIYAETRNQVPFKELHPTEFDGGRVLRLDGADLVEIAFGLHNPSALALGPDQSIYISEFGRGAVRRLLL